MSLEKRAKLRLLRVARGAAEAAASGRRPPEPCPTESGTDLTAGAFVTLRRGGDLRGCIGTFHAAEPLYRTVAEMARSAAIGDPRFPPVRPDEVSNLEIEISVLTPMRRIRDPNEIEVGRHGLCIARGHHRGVLLPQVATEYGWDRTEFLEHTCLKAGLPLNAWQEGADIYVFEAEVFGEREVAGQDS